MLKFRIMVLLAGILFSSQVFAADGVPIESEFPNKIVYTTDAGFDLDILKKDCAVRGGKFNECGSVCADPNEVCPSVCAFTCEFDKKK